MGTKELAERIEQYRTTYLEANEGRNHLEVLRSEQKEVQQDYRKLFKKWQSGEDITDLTLLRLLPYANTKYNRQRGTRISTWPCITKDIKAWFEGAKWKKPHEWSAVAQWLMEIVTAGSEENWELWQELSSDPIHKGFASGFISPIVYCLNPKLPVINSKVVRTYRSVVMELGWDSEISSDLPSYPACAEKIWNLIDKLEPYGITNYPEWDIYCHWNIAKRLGGKAAVTIEGEGIHQQEKPLLEKDLLSKDAEKLRQSLLEAQYDTQHPERFEALIAESFSYLGFETNHIGKAGNADVVASASLGEESFSLVIDAKTCQRGSSRGSINYKPVKDHQVENATDYVLVIAPAFAGGDTIKHALDMAVGLMETQTLIQSLEEHSKSGLSLYFWKRVFETQVGLLQIDFEQEISSREELLKATTAVLEVFEEHQRCSDAPELLKSENVYYLLQRSIPKHQIEHAISFLANPALDILREQDQAYVLTMPASETKRRIEYVARGLSNLF